ncbi:MAG: choice-of-anchor Q domain-containing protein, partial [Candidatus Tenebribacter mawsonii]|nr:choice-of-anchor Q domain-containing protein [Candidatus Tenebribacter mawsonii]
TFYIKQDGTGDFITIQEGIIAATDSDTILVYPGIYYENIDYLEKSLTVASLYIIAPEDSLINQTIIDGNQESRCVTIEDCESISLIGFTIQNGSAIENVSQGYMGGGILIDDVLNATVSNCIIQNNVAYGGGGGFLRNVSLCLSNNKIVNNWGIQVGGGLDILGNDTNIEFDEENLNSIFNNYSSTGSDIYIAVNVQNIVNIIVDTFTVTEPDYFFLISNDNHTFSCLNAKIEEIDQDLYVSPNGDDSNSGLTLDEPLQTLAWAQTIIKRNDENPNTIHLASGIYSPSLSNQIYPLNIKHGVIYEGVSSDETILDAELESPFFHQLARDQNEFAKLIMEDLKMINGDSDDDSKSGGINIYQADLYLDNVIIENCNGFSSGAIHTSNGYCNLNNVIIRNNNGWHALSLSIEYNCPNPVRDVNINNSVICDNQPNIIDPDFPGGGALKISGHPNIPGMYQSQLINCEIRGNHNASYNSITGLGGSVVLFMDDNITIDIVNCTFGENTLDYSTGSSFWVNNSELNLYNSILYNNDGYSFNLWEDAVVNISNSLIEGGDDNVNYYYPLAIVNWLDGNLDENPMFDSLGIYPFALLENSPCINAGTLDLPTGIELPEFDLAGNPRIYGESIDMGAYEFQGDPQSNDENEIIIPEITQISNYPNPFNPTTTIKLDLAESGKIELAIYNIKGQKVKTLMDAYSSKGHFEIIWRGVDDNKKKVASGQYLIKLKVNEEEKAVSKCVLLK